jgi:hypothetical protein
MSVNAVFTFLEGETMNTKPLMLVGAVVAAGHLIVEVAAFLIGVNAGWARFDQGGPASLVEQAATLITAVTSFPLVSLAMRVGGGLPVTAQWLVVAANSLLWGAAGAGLYHVTRRSTVRANAHSA